MQSKISETFQKARLALQKGDQRTAASLLNQILQQDNTHREAWQLLYEMTGSGESFETFQKKYAEKYLSNKNSGSSRDKDPSMRRVSLTGGKKPSPSEPLHPPTPAAAPPPKEKKPGFFARLFSIFRRKPKPEAPPTKSPPSTPSSAHADEKHSVRLSSIKGTPSTPSR